MAPTATPLAVEITPDDAVIFKLPPSLRHAPRGVSCRINLTNPSDSMHLIFKIKATVLDKYSVKPAMHALGPGESVVVKFVLRPPYPTSPPEDPLDRFLFMSTACEKHEVLRLDSTGLSQLWRRLEKERRSAIVGKKMPAMWVFPPSASSLQEETESEASGSVPVTPNSSADDLRRLVRAQQDFDGSESEQSQDVDEAVSSPLFVPSSQDQQQQQQQQGQQVVNRDLPGPLHRVAFTWEDNTKVAELDGGLTVKELRAEALRLFRFLDDDFALQQRTPAGPASVTDEDTTLATLAFNAGAATTTIKLVVVSPGDAAAASSSPSSSSSSVALYLGAGVLIAGVAAAVVFRKQLLARLS